MRCKKNRFTVGRPKVSFLGVLSMRCILDTSRDVKYAVGIQGKGPGWRQQFGSCQHVDGI